jgi:hypothetical protein
MNQPGDDWLDSLLEQGLAEEPLPDNGFTVRVLDAIPCGAGIPRPRLVLAFAWVLAGAGIACALAKCRAWEWLGGAWVPVARCATAAFADPWMGLVAVAILSSFVLAWLSLRSAFRS